MIKKPLLFLITLFSLIDSFAQQKTRPFELGALGGIVVYQGDLTPRRLGSFETLKPGLNLQAAKPLRANWLLRASLMAGSLKGDDALYDRPVYRSFRNFNFHTPLQELSLQLAWFPYGHTRKKRVLPYLFMGAGISRLNVNRDWSRFNAQHFVLEPGLPGRIDQDAAQDPPRLIPVLPAGAGLRYGLPGKWFLNLEFGYRLGFTDYIDGFSVAANPDKNDHYHTTMIGISRRFGIQDPLACPVLKY